MHFWNLSKPAVNKSQVSGYYATTFISPQYGVCLISPYCHDNLVAAPRFLENLCTPALNCSLDLVFCKGWQELIALYPSLTNGHWQCYTVDNTATLSTATSPSIHLLNSVLISDATDIQSALWLQKWARVLATGWHFQWSCHQPHTRHIAANGIIRAEKTNSCHTAPPCQSMVRRFELSRKYNPLT